MRCLDYVHEGNRALIYDLDNKAQPKKWTELAGVRLYYEFFIQHADEF